MQLQFAQWNLAAHLVICARDAPVMIPEAGICTDTSTSMVSATILVPVSIIGADTITSIWYQC